MTSNAAARLGLAFALGAFACGRAPASPGGAVYLDSVEIETIAAADQTDRSSEIADIDWVEVSARDAADDGSL